MSGSRRNVLLVEDDRKITELLTEYLSGFDFQVISTASPSQARKHLASGKMHIMILDVMLPQEDGFSLLRDVRPGLDIPVIMLTARGDLTDRVVGLELGADDYMSKPFEPRELIARMRALLRRSEARSKDPSDTLKYLAGSLELNTQSRSVILDGKELPFTTMEFDILECLMANRGIVLSRDRLTEMIHGEEFEPFNRTIDILISRIRNKLKDSPDKPKYIRTVRGAGYLFLVNRKD
ncbi:MAG: response regulator transcription factor [Leptospiraceae bacterium]